MPGHLIRRLHQISTQLFLQRAKEAGFDLTPVQFAAMEAICTHPDSEQAQIAALIAYDRATIGGVIDRLEQKGYVNRVVSQRDRRSKEVRLSEDGQAVLDRMRPVVRALQGEILENLGADDRAVFVSLARAAMGLSPENSAETEN
jgi:DNA-binding MarR family transcriptional regulator